MPRKKKKKRRLWSTVLKIVLASKVALLGAYYIGAKNPGPVRRLEDSLFYRNVPIAKDSFPDPAGLEVVVEVNEYGGKESYLVHGESGRRWSIGYDMLPKDLRVIERGLEQRLHTDGMSYIEPDEHTRRIQQLRDIRRRANMVLAHYDEMIAAFDAE